MFLLCTNQACASGLSEIKLPLDVVTFKEFKDSNPVFQDRNGLFLTFTKADVRCLAIVSNADGAQIAAQIEKWWSDHSPATLPIFSENPGNSENSARFTHWLISVLANEADDFRKYFSDILQQNSELRQRYEQMQTDFSAVENFINSSGLNYPIIQHETREISYFWSPTQCERSLSQILPVSAKKVQFFSLYFNIEEKEKNGTLKIELQLSGSKEFIFSKNIQFSKLKGGWNIFSVDHYSFERQDIILHCEWMMKDGTQPAPAIALSNMHWSSVYATRGSYENLSFRSVAMKIWSGLPGMKLPMINDDRTSLEQGKAQVIALDPEVLSRFRRARFPDDRTSVRYLPEIGRLEVHPAENGVVAAVSAEALPAGTSWIAADIRTLNAKADPVEYAMLVAKSDDEAMALLGQGGFIMENFSGWQVVHASMPARISLIINKPWHWDDRLYLATKLAPASGPALAWATWGGLEFGIHDESELTRSALGWTPNSAANLSALKVTEKLAS